MISIRRVLACCTVCIALCLPASADTPAGPAPPPVLTGGFKDHLESIQGGKLDWSNGWILAEGIGKALDRSPQQKAMAERAAEMAAARNALAMTQGIRIDANGRFSDVRDAVVRIEGVLKGYQVVKTEWQQKPRLQCKVTLRVPMWGARGLASVALPFYQARQAERPVARLPLTPQQVDVSDFVLVIDARGHKVAPCLFPAVVNKQGQVVYDAASLPGEQTTRVAVVRYVETDEQFEELRSMLEGSDTEEYRLAEYNPQAPTNKAASPATSAPATSPPAGSPRQRAKRRMAVKVAEAAGQQKTQLVLTQEDAERLRKSPEASSAMRNAQVLVVVDAAAAGVEGRGPSPLEEFLATAWPRP